MSSSALKALRSALRGGSADLLRDELVHWGSELGPEWTDLAGLDDGMLQRAIRRKLKPGQDANRTQRRASGLEQAERQLAQPARLSAQRQLDTPIVLPHQEMLLNDRPVQPLVDGPTHLAWED